MDNKFLKVLSETPILNIPNFQEVFGGQKRNCLLTDEKGHIRSLEFIALKDMVFKIIKQTSYPYIYEIEADWYEKKQLFIDSRFTKEITFYLPKNNVFNMTEEEISEKLHSMVGIKYLWGGNWSQGIEKLIKFYPPSVDLENDQLNKWKLKGVDCSGFLFEVTNGFTPRNTKELMNFKNPIKIKGLTYKEIIEIIKPLDLIVYQGHIVIILNSDFTIESREKFGVVKTPIIDRLKELLLTKKPSNHFKNSDDFVIRRWI